DGAAIDVDLVQIPAQFTGHRQRLGGKGLVGLDQIQLIDLPAGLAQAALGSPDRAYAHDRRLDTGTGAGGDTGEYRQTQLSRRFGTHQHDRSGAVVEAGGVARGDGAVVAERRTQLAQRLQGGTGAGLFVLVDAQRVALALGYLHRGDLVSKTA